MESSLIMFFMWFSILSSPSGINFQGEQKCTKTLLLGITYNLSFYDFKMLGPHECFYLLQRLLVKIKLSNLCSYEYYLCPHKMSREARPFALRVNVMAH